MQVPATVEHRRFSAQVLTQSGGFDLVYLKRLWIEHHSIILESTFG